MTVKTKIRKKAILRRRFWGECDALVLDETNVLHFGLLGARKVGGVVVCGELATSTKLWVNVLVFTRSKWQIASSANVCPRQFTVNGNGNG